ncbi:IclR family transcriptional regulator [Deferribacter thermophilus]|uniref:IclR family transcriptional regulator n=1 Tax=Deferribacter thermophilus TaxID=53573 RepID=UPI003C26F6C2
MVRRDKSEYAVQAVNNALDILELLGKSDQELSISEIGAKLGLTRSNVNKLLATLESFGYVEYNKRTGNFRMDVKTFQISQAYLNKLNLIEASKQILTEIKKEVNETVHISVLRKGNIVYLNAVETDHSVRVVPRIGNIGPAYATATGKAQLAFIKLDKIKEYYSEKLVKMTDNTIDNMEDLLKELDLVRQRGYATDFEEFELGVRCVGAPVFNFMGNVIAGLSISAPVERMSEERIEKEIIPAVLKGAYKLSIKYGYKKEAQKGF